jgi:hypothetical protein
MTSDDQRYARYLTARAVTIELPPGDPSSVVARAAARRRRRRTVGSSLAAIALVTGAVTVQQIGSNDTSGGEVASQADAVTAAEPFRWSTVVPNVGLSWSNSTAVTDDGTQFGLSTAPGRYDPDEPGKPQTLYRSVDGVEWSTVELPADLWPSQLAASGNDLYAVGTSPAAGGGRSVVLARSAADGAWDTLSLPLDLAALDAQYPGLGVHGLDVAAGAGGIVASVVVQAYLDAAPYLPADLEGAGWTWTATGLEVYGAPEGCTVRSSKEIDCGDPAATTQPSPRREGQVIASYTFAELGIGSELQSLIAGQLHVFASSDGATFDEVTLPEGARGQGSVVATDDGFVLFATEWTSDGSNVGVLVSGDGRSWTVDGAAGIDGWLSTTGTIGGRAAAVLQSQNDGGAMLRVHQPDGSWSTLDLDAVVSELGVPAGRHLSVGSADIGPLGAAAVVSTYDGVTGEIEQNFVVYSPDGRSISIQPLATLPAAPAGYPGAVRVSADTVTIVFGDANSDDDVSSSTLLVGTKA